MFNASFLHCVQIILPLISESGVVAMLMTPQVQVTSSVCLPASDCMLQKHHAIQSQCVPKVVYALLLSWCDLSPFKIKWAEVALHWSGCELYTNVVRFMCNSYAIHVGDSNIHSSSKTLQILVSRMKRAYERTAICDQSHRQTQPCPATVILNCRYLLCEKITDSCCCH